MKTKLFLGFFFLSSIFLTSCENGPGTGGKSTIRGKVIVREYNESFSVIRDEYPGAKEDVYIVYGDDYVYGDRFETSYDGTYEFNYLREGNYTVYAYSKDSTNMVASEQVAVIQQVEITGKDQVVEVPDIIIASCENDAGTGGTSTIRGKVFVREYNGDFTILRDEYPGAKEDVYIIYGDDYVYGDKFEANYDGSYEFNYLREGSYTVYAYSKDSTNLITAEKVAVMEQVEITGGNQVVEVPDIFILQ
jgi:hypothetical protein